MLIPPALFCLIANTLDCHAKSFKSNHLFKELQAKKNQTCVLKFKQAQLPHQRFTTIRFICEKLPVVRCLQTCTLSNAF